MGTTTLPYRYLINGLIDTSRTVLSNLELIANACSTWITYDAMEGKWSIVINRQELPKYSFNDDNIISGINLSTTGLTQYYNSAEVSFPHRDLRDQTDLIRIDTPSELRLPNEPDNTLTMDYPIINEPVHAQIVALIELKQSRLDKVINFQTDYSRINMAAGDVVQVTNDVYGWTNKLFRIIRMEEQDVDGTIVIDVTCLEYDIDTYSTADLYRYTRTDEDGLTTIGVIGRPSTPTTVLFETDVRPRIVATTVVPDGLDPTNIAGLVNNVEFWIYKVPPAEVPDYATIDDATRNYTLYTSLQPSNTNVWLAGTEVTFDIDTLDTGYYLIKTRCTNFKTAGPYSLRTNLITFTNTQATQALPETTTILDSNSLPIEDLYAGKVATWALSSAGGTTFAATAAALGYDTATFTKDSGAPADATVQSISNVIAGSEQNTKFNSWMGTPTMASGFNGVNYNIPASQPYTTFTLGYGAKLLQFLVPSPTGLYKIRYWSSSTSADTFNYMNAYLPVFITVYYDDGQGGAVVILDSRTADWQTNNTIFTYSNAVAGDYTVIFSPLQSYDINQDYPGPWDPSNPANSNQVWPYEFTAGDDLEIYLTITQ